MAFALNDVVVSELLGTGAVIDVYDSSKSYETPSPDGYPYAVAFVNPAWVLKFESDGTMIMFNGWYSADGVSYVKYTPWGEDTERVDTITLSTSSGS